MVTRKKILHLLPRFVFGGAEVLVLEYARRLDRGRFELRVAAVRKGGGLEPYLKAAGVDTFAISRQRDGGLWWQWLALKKYAQAFKPDIIHSHIFSADVCAFLLKRFVMPQVKWVSTQHNVEYDTPLYRRLLWSLVLQQADKVIAVSGEVRHYAQEYFGVRKDQVEFVPNGVAIERWLAVPEWEPKKEANAEWRLAAIGRLEYQKGHRYLIEALAQIKDLPWRLDVYGVGSLEVYLKELVKKHGLNERVRWYGVRGDLDKKIGEVDILIQPSLWEGMSLVVMEAMAAGRLLVATQTAGAELVEHGENGHLVPVKDSAELARVIKYYFEHPEEVQRLTRNAREYACRHFDVKDNVAGVEEIYDELAR